MTNIDEMVIATYAQAAALFEPLRRSDSPPWASTHVLRRGFRERGMPWRGGAEKDTQRALDAAVNAGLVIRRRGRAKTIGVRLTDDGLLAAWRLLGTTADDAVRPLPDLLSPRPCAWVRETALTGGRGWGDNDIETLRLLQTRLLPALVAGWVESNTTILGQVCYRLTDSGLDIALEYEADDEPEVLTPSREAIDLYRRVYAETIFWLDSLDVSAVGHALEIGPAPLSVADLGPNPEPSQSPQGAA